MKNLLALAAFLALVFLSVGWFRGWYDVESSSSGEGKNQVIIQFNSQRIKQDLNTGREKLKRFLDSGDEGDPQPAAPATDGGLKNQTLRPDVTQPATSATQSRAPQPTHPDDLFILPPPTAGQAQSQPSTQPDTSTLQQVPWIFPE